MGATWNALDQRRGSGRRLPVLAAAAALTISLPAAPAAAQEEEEPVSRKEELLLLIEILMKSSSADSPSVLGDVHPGHASARDLKAFRILRGTRADIDLEKQPVETALELFSRISGLTFIVSARARKTLDEEKPELSLAFQNLPLENVLNLTAIHLRGFRFVLRYGAVVLIRDEEYRPKRALVIYNVSDLTRPRPNFAAPPLGLGSEKQ